MAAAHTGPPAGAPSAASPAAPPAVQPAAPPAVQPVALPTSRGPAHVWVLRGAGHRGRAVPPAAVLLHGAGSGACAAPLPDLAAALAAAGITAVLLDQPYRVAGRRAPDRAPLLDTVLAEVVATLRAQRVLPAAGRAGLALVGRSSGARVACRSAAALRACSVVALGFPWQPPARPGRPPAVTRAGELTAGGAACPVLVLQGDQDPFGQPSPTPGVTVHPVPRLGHTPDQRVVPVAVAWLTAQLRPAAPAGVRG